jgi:hypothetical protein
VRLMPPAYAKPFVKRQKNDMADAKAICEAVTRANMRFVPTKTPQAEVAPIQPTSKRLHCVPGVGPMLAAALVARALLTQELPIRT